MVAVRAGLLVRREAQPVLRAELLADLLVDVGHRLLLADLEQPSSRLAGHALKDLPAVGCGNVLRAALAGRAAARISSGVAAGISARIAASRVTAGIAAAIVPGIPRMEAPVRIRLFPAFEVDGVNDGVGALGRLD